MGKIAPTIDNPHPLTFKEKVSDFKFRIRYGVYCSLLHFRAWLSRGFGPGPVILCYPEMPRFFHMLTLLAAYMGAKLTNNPALPHDAVLHFEDMTVRPTHEILEQFKSKEPVINAGAGDIGKERVERIFSQVFGYASHIDPRTHTGVCVSKSVVNALHDGEIIQCPTQPVAGRIYQKLIDCREGDLSYDVRVPIIGGTIPIVWKKYRYLTSPFKHLVKAVPVDASELYSPEEIRLILSFAKEFGLDYGELDVMRDSSDGKIYIFDVNNTPATVHPAEHMTWSQYGTMTRLLSNAFSSAFLATYGAKASSAARTIPAR